MKTYKELYKELEDKLKADLKQARKLDKENYNKAICKHESATYGDNMSTADDMRQALMDFDNDTTFATGYIEVIDTIDYDVEGWASDGEIEVEHVYAILQVDAYRPMTDEEFNILLGSEFTMQDLFKGYISPLLFENAKLLKVGNTYRRFQIPCSLLKLYQQDILDFDGLTKAVYSNC